MRRPRLTAVLLAAALAAGACDGKGEDNNPADEERQQAGADSLSTGEAVPTTAPPAGTVSPGAPGAPLTTDTASQAAHTDSGHTDTAATGTRP
ncbi:MAG TPA: hypothetical protein VFQ45_03415 [Longimicrobium sp.]|nr:hypothetical protein [Longimicrobium sp.]